MGTLVRNGLNVLSWKGFYNQLITLLVQPSLDGGPYHMQSKSVNWFLYGRDLRHERVKKTLKISKILKNTVNICSLFTWF